MSASGNSGSLEILPNRLAVVEFHPVELGEIIGEEEDQQKLRTENFNWLAAYLCDEAGVSEDDLLGWFRQKAPGLGNRSPLSVWTMEDGFGRLFEYAQVFKQLSEEEVNQAEPPAERDLTRSHQLARYATRIARDGFRAAGVDLTLPTTEADGIYRAAIHNPLADRNYVQAVWKAGVEGDLLYQTYKIYSPNEHPGLFYIVDELTPPEPDDKETMILKTGIIGAEGMDSDIDFRPPTAGKVSTFVVPLAEAVRERALITV